MGGGPEASFVRQGEYWALAFEGQFILLRDAKGLQYLAALLRRPGEKISVAELVGDGAEALGHTDLERHRSAVTKRIRDALNKIEKNHPALGRHLHARVKTGYECGYVLDPDQPVIWRL